MQGSPVPNEHETVGAYALGILDDAEATAFESHLAGCEWCAQQLDELAGMEPMLAALADLPGTGTPSLGESLSAKPAPRVVEKLVDEVAERRAKKRRRNFYMVAAAGALIVSGPFVAVAANGGGDSGSRGGNTNQTLSADPAKDVFDQIPDKLTATDPGTKVSVTVAFQEKDWGTGLAAQISNVKGPEKCALVVVGKNGERETATSWTVPEWGYGLPDAKSDKAKQPLHVQGGASLDPDEIDSFEIVTFDGEKLVEVDA
ncbi:anti-sigma factor family protein [Streptomyces sp. KMM 9044]|uniref:anti-sigma factor family protein n=1 Tax=Streptomyces sp. KMM 9044 TaxID=2744474 RepID=UPI002151BF84|nr:zf-HC2 domain-containing protein [Streptomyces sp. KMM 9044]WAX79760.1 zf-HC2 domain-containing protein [Streptomyces sp. KMM 9044]